MPTQTIEQFIAHISRAGVARPNRFRITINTPTSLSQEIARLNRDSVFDQKKSLGTEKRRLEGVKDAEGAICIMAQNVSLPGWSASTVEHAHGATSRKVPYDKTQGEFDSSILCSGNMIEKRLIDAWYTHIFRPDHTVAYYDDIIGHIRVEMLNEMDEVVYSVDYTECYPLTVTPTSLDRTTQNTTATFQVTWCYHKMHASDEDYPKNESKLKLIQSQLDAQQQKLGINLPPPLQLPPAPPPEPHWPMAVITFWKYVDRIQKQMENGTLNTEIGRRLVLNAARELRAAAGEGFPGDAVDQALTHIGNLDFILNRK